MGGWLNFFWSQANVAGHRVGHYLGERELRIGAFRIFYDVDEAEAAVKIKAIGRKEHNKLYLRGKEYVL